MKYVRLAMVFPFVLASLVLSCSMTDKEGEAKDLRMTFSTGSGASPLLRSVSPRTLIDDSSLGFAFAVEAQQSGVLATGNSSDTTFATISYKVSTTGSDGTILGAGGESQSFTLPNPHIKSNLPDGSVVKGMYGTFIISMENGQTTQLVLKRNDYESSGALDSINEVVMRLGGNLDGQGNSIITEPHFFSVDEAGTSTTYADVNCNLLLNGGSGQTLGLEYILFVPASIVGSGFNSFVSGNRQSTVADPVLGDEMVPIEGQPNSSTFKNPPSSWTLNPAWKDDAVGNAGLFEMMDRIAGITDPSQRQGSEKWQSLAVYFQTFFAKYYKASCTMFNITSPYAASGGIPSGLGNCGHSSFLLIALDDSAGPIGVSNSTVINVVFEPSASTFDLDTGTGKLNITGDPALRFTTKVTTQP
jgi:hypothetical protein